MQPSEWGSFSKEETRFEANRGELKIYLLPNRGGIMVYLLARRADVPKDIHPREMEPRLQLCALIWAANCDLRIFFN